MTSVHHLYHDNYVLYHTKRVRIPISQGYYEGCAWNIPRISLRISKINIKNSKGESIPLSSKGFCRNGILAFLETNGQNNFVVQLLSHVQLFATPWTAACQASLSFTTPGVCSNSHPLSQWCHPTISSSVSPSPPVLNLPQHQDLFQWVSCSHQVAKVLKLQHQSCQWIFRIDVL